MSKTGNMTNLVICVKTSNVIMNVDVTDCSALSQLVTEFQHYGNY